MAGLLKKIASGLDFWDKKENKSQRDQFAREDEEERKRRERAAQEKPKQAATLFEGSALSPGAIVQPQKKQASQVASQSDYTPPQKLAKATEPLAFKPSEKELKASNKPSKSLKDRAIDSVASSAARVSVGIAQGASGLYDLLTPGKGTNRVSKSLDKEAKSVDDYAKENTNQKAYKAGNVVGEIASYLAPSKIASSVVTGIPKAARVASKGAEAAAKLIGDSTKLRKVGSDAAREVLSPENILSDTAITSKYIGEDASKGKDISPVSVALDVATGVAGNALLPAAKGLNSLRKATTKELGETPSLPGSIQNGKPLMERAKTVEIAPGVKSSNLPKVVEEKANAPVEDPMPTPPHLTPVNENLVIPDPANPMALAKVESPAAMPTLSSDMPNQVMANFKDSIAAPLQKAAPIEVPVSTVVPPPSEPIENVPVPLSDPTAVDVADATNNVGALPGQAAPRTRARAASLISDEDLRADVAEAFPGKQVLNIAETENAAKTAINNMTDDQLIVSFSNPSAVETPEDFFRAVNSIRRLEKIGTPEAEGAIRNAIDGMSEYSARSGRNLRTTQILFEDMPTVLKVDYLEKKIAKAGAEMSDTDRAILTNLIEQSDNATDNLRALEDEARDILDSGSINNAGLDPNVSRRAGELKDAIVQATREKEIRAGEAWRFYQQSLPNTGIGKRFGDVGRTLMLSSPTGRVFDIASTAITAADDIAAQNISGLIGKVVNKFKGPGAVNDQFVSPRKLIEGGREGLTRAKDSFKGDDYVEDFIGEAQRASRGDINTGNGIVRRGVRSLVELPTNLSRGLRNDELYRQGMQEASQQGLKGDAQKTYAELRATVPSEQQLRQAQEVHLKANMLHDNRASRFLNNIANSLDKGAGGWAGPFIRNQVAPFTSWLGGNLHRTLTDKNVLYNVGSAVNNARKGNTQGVIDDIAKLSVNTTQAYAAGVLLTQAGILSTTDGEGNDYAGLYFHIGDRYIPVAAAGTVSVPIIMGNALQQGLSADSEDGSFGETFLNSISVNTLKNAGVASVFGGENNLQTTIADLASGRSGAADAISKYVGDFTRQYIPALTSDINALVDSTPLNPTGEAAETKVTSENPETGREKTDIIPTEINKTLNRLPGFSQSLDRKEGSNAKDLLDRITKGDQESDKAAQNREQKQSLDDLKKQLRKDNVRITDDGIKGHMDDGEYGKAIKGLEYKLATLNADPESSNSSKERVKNKITEATLKSEGVPVTDEGIKARTEDGKYGDAIRGLEYQLSTIKDDKDTPESKKKQVRDDILRLKVTEEGAYAPETVKLYSSISLAEWRNMADPEHEDYDPEQAAILQDYDTKLAEAGVSRDDKNPKRAKYYAKGSRGGGKAKSISTDISKIGFNPGVALTPIKAREANVAARKSVIPTLEKVANNDRSKLKKITVTSGG